MKKTSLRPYYGSLFKNNLKNLLEGLSAVIIKAACGVGLAWLIQQLLDACTGSPQALPFKSLLLISVTVTALYLGGLQLERVSSSRFVPQAMAQYKSFLFSKISGKSIDSFRRENTAAYLSLISNDSKTVQLGLSELLSVADCLLRMIFALVLMLWYSAAMTAGVIIIAAIFCLISVPGGRKLVEAEQELSESNEGLTDRFRDFLSGFPVVKAFQAEREMAALFREKLKISAEADRKRSMADMMFAITIDGGLAAARVAILLVGAGFAISGKGVSAGMVIAFAELLDNVLSPVQELPLLLADMKAADALIRRAADKLEKNIREEGEDIPPRLEDKIRIDKLSFAYGEGKPVLRGLSHSFSAGRRYALVGGSGSGKSTLLQLLMGGSSYEGGIYIDGKELQSISSRSLYELAALISQNVFLFNATIQENITMFRDFPQEELERAVQLSGLSQLIGEKGPGFLCGENGCRLSGGEKQRISIARALLRKSSVLLVDEATSALDKETAAQVSQSLLLLSGVTEIIVTHALDPQLLEQYDEIIALKEGRIEEAGTFSELMEKRGYFRSLYEVSR